MKASTAWVEDRPGFFRMTVAVTNCYVIRDPEGVTLVDAGLSATGKVLDALSATWACVVRTSMPSSSCTRTSLRDARRPAVG
ncbi:hypothetical protein Q9S36_01735 [Microbacterium sp. ARD31]|uniref:hypothetical protein n=1 Tax=Microbacterium sp. ARD31 TaxID=2962576 RepID=UPI002880DDC9|nr:hypothetical protein [Microbacterium sp. ARD31]MDT0178934.1 hypothetical protein [Microbacterium sp. ARD31]